MTSVHCPRCQMLFFVDDIPEQTTVACPQCAAQVPLSSAAAHGDAGDPQVSPEDEQVLAELVQLQNQQPGWGSAILLLVVSLLLFAGSFKGGRAWDGVVILVAVVAFHEAGHYVAMRWFGYRNLRMFFIPFLGAAVSGRHYNVAGWKKSLVALAGPVPGILLGAPLGILGLALGQPKIVQASLVLLGLNGFNLLPFLPLDGGWVVHAVLFVRHPVLDVVFRVVAALGLLGLSLVLQTYLLVALAVFMLIAIPVQWRLANVAHRLRQQGVAARSADAESIPLGPALTILAAVRPILPKQSPPKLLAQNVANVFEALNAAPPGALATIGLLALHGGSFMLALVMAVLISILQRPGA